jgi:hypothetical protein
MLPQPPLESSFTACLERERGKRPNPGVLKRCFYQWRISRERERERERLEVLTVSPASSREKEIEKVID